MGQQLRFLCLEVPVRQKSLGAPPTQSWTHPQKRQSWSTANSPTKQPCVVYKPPPPTKPWIMSESARPTRPKKRLKSRSASPSTAKVPSDPLWTTTAACANSPPSAPPSPKKQSTCTCNKNRVREIWDCRRKEEWSIIGYRGRAALSNCTVVKGRVLLIRWKECRLFGSSAWKIIREKRLSKLQKKWRWQVKTILLQVVLTSRQRRKSWKFQPKRYWTSSNRRKL